MSTRSPDLSDVEALDIDEIIPLDDPRPDGAVNPTPQPPPGATTPNNNPYMPIGDIGASQFMAANPTWDGRGVTVGILDSGVTLDHPSLLTTSTGERKIVDWVTYTDPFTDDDPTWVSMADQVSGASFTYMDVTYTAPAAGSYRIGLFNERDPRLGGEVGNDVNRDGNPAGSSGIFAVLWNTNSNDVYVDANQNNNFADELAMTDYRVRYDVGTFGVDNPATAISEAMPFVIQTDGKNKVVNIGIVSAAHGSHVAGIVAGNSLFGGAMSGAAPGAQVISVRVCLFVAGCTAHALVEGMIFAAKQGNVDVINMSIGGLPGLNDGNNARAIVYNRLVEQFDVQIFISAGNSGAGINTVGDPSVASKVMSVGAYITDDTWAANYGSTAAHEDNLHPFSSRGPREDGGFKPQIVAPGAAISTTPRWQAGGPVSGTYELPPGYSMFNGTSMASPQAAGAAALLVSAAEQAGAQHKPDQLRQALNSSTRFVDPARIGAHEQGNGLIDVGAAWELLKTNIKTVAITSSVPVNTVLSGFLATPGVGEGIFDREDVAVGESYTRTYTFMRTSGGSKPITYNLSWVGNDGTFSSAGSIALALNKPVTLDVTINPATAGTHAAILNLDDPGTTGIDYQTMNLVVAAETFSADNGYTHDEERHDRPQRGAELLLRHPGRHAGVQSRSVRSVRRPGNRAGPLPALPPVGCADRREQQSLLLPAAGPWRRLWQPAQPHRQQPAGGRLGDRRRGATHVRRSGRELHADGINPRRHGRAESGHHRVGDDGCSGRAFLHDHERARRLHGPRGRDNAWQRVARHVQHREPRTAAVLHRSRAGFDIVPGHDRQSVRSGR